MNTESGNENKPRATGESWHLVPVEVWNAVGDAETYEPETFAAEGFIHTTNEPGELMAAGNRYYQADPRAYFVLRIDLDHPAVDAVYDNDRRVFPHLYHPLPVAAVTAVHRVDRGPDGAFLAIGERADGDRG